MTATVFIAVIGAALLHAVWNAVVKGGADKWVSMAAIVLGHVPFALAALMFAPAPDPASFPWMAAGVALHIGYQFFLLWAYQQGDLTQVYPIARGSAPLIVALVSVTALGVHLAAMEMVAVAIIACGILSLALMRRSGGASGGVVVLALVTGMFIAGYSLVDGMGARAAGSSVGYYAWLSLINAAITGAYLAMTAPARLRAVFGPGLRTFVIGGGASFAAYAIVTWAFTQAPIALVTALRETSVVFALLIGVVVLRERFDLVKFASTLTTLVGAVLLRIARP